MGGIIIVWLIIVAAATWGGYALGKQKGQEIAGLLIGLGSSMVGVLLLGIIGGLVLGGIGTVITAAVLPPKALSAAHTTSRGDGALSQRLAELDELKRQGRITDDEHKAARAKVLGLGEGR